MIRHDPRDYLPRPVNFDLLWESDLFLEAFCSGCGELAAVVGSPYAECPACADPHCELCARHSLAILVDDALEEAAGKVLGLLRAWGCGL